MKTHSMISDKSMRWSEEFDSRLFLEFDAWMTRQLNCLVGRNLRFATPAQTQRQSDEAGANGNTQRS